MQLQAIKAERGAQGNDGSEAALKPLVDVLREAKEAKEEAFQAVWRSMKTGASPTRLVLCVLQLNIVRYEGRVGTMLPHVRLGGKPAG